MYESDEQGELVPTRDGDRAVGRLYRLYTSKYWYQGIVNMAVKVVLAALLGVLFQKDQIAGAFLSALFCAFVMAYFALVRTVWQRL